MLTPLLPSRQVSEQRAVAIQQLQLEVMRFADEYVAKVHQPLVQFQNRSTDPNERLSAQNWKLQQSTSVYTIASGPNPVINALDMVVLATLSRMVMDDSWVGTLYGQCAAPLQQAHRDLEPAAWALLDDELTADQKEGLRQVIKQWRARNPQVIEVSYIHFQDFARAVGLPAQTDATRSGGSLFAVLGLDPLSNLDPAVREIAQTRALAERTIYYLQRAPNLLDMQIERLTFQFAAMPETRLLLSNIDRTSAAAAATGQLAAQLPQVIATEREASIRQVMVALNSQQSQTRDLANELRAMLEAGSVTSDSLNRTIHSLDTFMARFAAVRRSSDRPGPAAKPFDIADYANAASELAAAAQELQRLLVSAQTTAPAAADLTHQASNEVQTVIDHAFWRLLQLVLLTIAGSTLAVCAYRLLFRALRSA